ncbi:hypothetical protein OBBRIDRAFT_797519, partial [Obba rivulosa]
MKLGIPRSIGHELRQLLDPANYSGRFPILYRTQWNEVHTQELLENLHRYRRTGAVTYQEREQKFV